MNREIKFRIWDTQLKKFETTAPSGGFSNPSINISLSGELVWECEYGNGTLDKKRYVLQQFTGLKDKNGKEIYEGDIVRTSKEHISRIFGAQEYSSGHVQWWNEGFAVCQNGIGAVRLSEYAFCNCCSCGLEIIGNIYETK